MEQKKVSPSRAKKEKIVAKLSEKAVRAKGFVFTNYQGLTHVQLEKLKKALKPLNAELAITKNTLLLRSLEGSEFKTQISELQGPTATLFMYEDIVTPLKALAKTIKELTLPTIKLAIIEDKILTSDDVIKISALPSREILVAQFIGMMKLPIYKLQRTLSWNMQKFVMTLKAIETKKA